MSTPEHWGQRLSKVLKEKNITQKKAASVAGVRPSVLSGWLSGASPTDHLAVKKLSDFLSLGFTWLLTGDAEKGVSTPTVTELFEEKSYFDGYARIRIDHLIPRKSRKKE